MAAGTGRGTTRLGRIIADSIEFTDVGEGIKLPEGTPIPGLDDWAASEVPRLVEEYLLQLPGSGPNTYLTMAPTTGDLTWAPIPAPTPAP